MDDILPLIINSPNQYVAAKDTYGKYLFCNDNVAQIAQLDSPKQIIGKSDYDLIWHNYADLYRRGDNVILKGGNWFNVEEPQLQANGPAKILITKSQLLNKSMECCGVITSFIDITGHTLKKVSGYYDPQKHRFYLGEVFENTYLTNAEYLTFKYLCLGYSSKKIGLQLELSPRTIEIYINKLKIKLKCNYKSDIIEVAVKHGFIYALTNDSNSLDKS